MNYNELLPKIAAVFGNKILVNGVVWRAAPAPADLPPLAEDFFALLMNGKEANVKA